MKRKTKYNLIEALENRQTIRVERMILGGINCNGPIQYRVRGSQYYPLEMAIKIRSGKLVKLMLEHGTKIQRPNECAYLLIKRNNYYGTHVATILRTLIEVGGLLESGEEAYYIAMRIIRDLPHPDNTKCLWELLRWDLNEHELTDIFENLMMKYLPFYSNRRSPPEFIEDTYLIIMMLLVSGASHQNITFDHITQIANGVGEWCVKDVINQLLEISPKMVAIFIAAGCQKFNYHPTYLSTRGIDINIIKQDYQKLDREMRKERLIAILPKITTICFGLAPLNLSAPETMAILNQAYPRIEQFPEIWIWNIVTKVKHFHDDK